MELTDHRMHDGSRLFLSLPFSTNWHALRDHVAKLGGATETGFLTDDVTEAWIEFTYREHQFTINNQLDEWWFFVTDPSCPDSTLLELGGHFRAMLGN